MINCKYRKPYAVLKTIGSLLWNPASAVAYTCFVLSIVVHVVRSMGEKAYHIYMGTMFVIALTWMISILCSYIHDKYVHHLNSINCRGWEDKE